MNSTSVKRWLVPLALVALLASSGAQAADRTWVCPSTTTGNWFEVTNWNGGGTYPGAGDTALITNGYVLLTNETATLGSFAISNATLIFSNWATALRATNVTIWSGGTVTVANAFTTNQMSNRVWVVCSNFALNAAGQVLVDACGYAKNNGPGTGTDADGMGGSTGGGYGGKGGRGSAAGYAVGRPYGSTNAPLDPGSGGGGGGNSGGGAVLIEAGGTMTIDGTVSANGGNSSGWGGAGSGGAIYIACALFGGTNSGILRANGGDVSGGGGGGGGRIAVYYTSLVGTPAVRFSANHGLSLYPADVNAADEAAPQPGTLFFSTPELLDGLLALSGGIAAGLNGYPVFQSTNAWAPEILALSNSTLGVAEDCRWQFTNDLTVVTGGVIVAAHATLNCDGNLTLTNGASLTIYGGATNATYSNSYGTLVSISNVLDVSSASWIYPFSHPTNGGSVLLRVGSLTVRSGGGINADGRGYMGGIGTGTGADADGMGGSTGGGYGGKGGRGSAAGYAVGPSYGASNAPLDPGSGGGKNGGTGGGCGGGAVRIEVNGAVTLDGTVTANGGDNRGWSGAGSGGAIFISCASFAGNANGILQTIGGISSSAPGGGGGGRIAVWVNVPNNMRNRYLITYGADGRAVARSSEWPQFSGTLSVAPGAGYFTYPEPDGPYPGTCFFFKYVKGTTLAAD